MPSANALTSALTSIDLFAGAGGLSEGLRQAGFRTIYANDHEKPAMETFKRNHAGAKASADNIEEIDANELREELGLAPGELDCLAGGPPCQGFSTYGKRNDADIRNQLHLHYLRFLDAFRPRSFVIENVTGILSMSDGRIVEDIIERLRGFGYGAKLWTLDAREYGVPQSRKRVFIVGLQDGGVVDPPKPSHTMGVPADKGPELFLPALPSALTIRDAISDLPADTMRPSDTHKSLPYRIDAETDYQRLMRLGSTEIHNHSSKQMLAIRRLRLALMRPGDWGRDIEERLANDGLPEGLIDRLLGGDERNLRDFSQCRKQDREKELALRNMLASGHTSLKKIMQFMDSQGFANKYRRLEWDRPSHTLVAHMARDCSDFVHPQIDRFISVREAARLQSFPDRYYFMGSQFMQLRQIGNAVPPLLGKAVGSAIAQAITAHCSQQNRQIRHDHLEKAGL